MAIVKVSELQGAALDWAVGKACSGNKWENEHFRAGWMANWKPSTDWSQGGPLIAEHLVASGVENMDASRFWAYCGHCWESHHVMLGDSYLIAICRAIVSAKLGDEIDVPDELIDNAS